MRLRALSLTAVAATFLFAGLASAASAPKTAVFPVPAGMKVGPNLITGNGFYVTATTISYDGTASGLPCFFCAPGSSIAIPYPITIFSTGTATQTIAQFYSSSYSGIPIIYEKTTINGVLTDSQVAVFSGPFGPGYIGYAYFLGTTSASGSGTIFISAVDETSGTVLATGGTKFGVE